jgi:hypothetical protein
MSKMNDFLQVTVTPSIEPRNGELKIIRFPLGYFSDKILQKMLLSSPSLSKFEEEK